MGEVINTLSEVATIVTAGTLVIALLGYNYQRRRDRLTDAVNQLTFFREKIITKNGELVDYVKNIDPNYKFERIKVDDLDLKWLQTHEFDKSLKQIELSGKDQKILNMQNDLFNMLEELSVKIRIYETLKEADSIHILDAIKPAFVETVEQNITFALFNRDIIFGKSCYSETLDLYMKWKDNVERKTPDERLKEFKEK